MLRACSPPREDFVAQRSWLSLILGSLLVLTGVGCTKPDSSNGGSDGGSVDAGDGDGGNADAGDGKCHSQNDCSLNKYCDLKSGDCLDAKPCAPNEDIGDSTGMSACEYQDNEEAPDYCWNASCYCDLTRNGGTCLPRVPKCGTCTDDTECGKDSNWYLVPGKCVEFTPTNGEGSAAKVCLPAPSPNAACPTAYVRSNDPKYAGVCIPAGGACGAGGACSNNDDCDAEGKTPVCQVSPGGYCIAACTFDWRTGDSTCANGKVCHMDMRLTKPTSNRNFGAGYCEAPCDVENGYECPTGTACVADGPSGKTRCRPPQPSCIRDEDCSPDPATHTTGYCNLSTFQCELKCTKPTHCATGYSCVAGECTEKTCTDQGGANIACIRGQFCAGEAGGPTAPSGVSDGSCYDSKSPPWCGTCSTDGKFMSKPDDVNRPTDSFCAGTFQWHSCDPKGPLAQCPQGWRCDDGPSFCTADSDCGPQGKCGDIQFQPIGAMNPITTKACLCNDETKNWQDMCPSTATECGKDMDGKPTVCLSGWCDMRFCPWQ
jgi:hypothetical protein